MTGALIIAFLITGDFVCPEGSKVTQRKTAEARERWCKMPDGTRHGPRHAWHADGSKWFEGQYRHGKRQGEWTFWHANGKLRSKGSYVDDKRDGPSTHWHDSGEKALQGHCKAGAEDGVWKSWWPNGKPEAVIRFVNGAPSGRAVYTSRRGLPVDLEAWIGEKVRGARAGSPRFERAKKRFATNGIFEECGS